MTADGNAIAGKVSSIAPWKTGKGAFVKFEGDENDYFYFGPQKCGAGEQCTFEIAPGKGNFEDKIELKKKLSGPDEGSEAAPRQQTKNELFESAAQDGLTVYMDKQNLIVAQTCLKAAAELVGELAVQGDGKSWKEIGTIVCDLQDQFFTHIIQSQNGAKTNSKGK